MAVILLYILSITKASAAQTSRHAEPNYFEAYSAQRTDSYTSGLRSLYLPPDAVYVTSTGSPHSQRFSLSQHVESSTQYCCQVPIHSAFGYTVCSLT